jgi:phage recombination protein Bet
MNDAVHGTSLAVMQEQDLIEVLRNSLYPGAAPESAALVLGYCRAAGLDPMLKPVHIVPMYAATGKFDQKGKPIKAMRDVVMPGIGMYRIQAARTGQYAGQDEPVFGPSLPFTYTVKKTEWRDGRGTDTWTEKTITYPEWCSVTIYRLVAGFRSAFTATEFWTENYATAGRDSDSPNEMWAKRTRGQLAKCAEAQALRKAFPEVGQAPTADEMEGKYLPEATDEQPPTFTETKVKPRRASEVVQDVTPPALPEPTAPVVLEPVIQAVPVTVPVEDIPPAAPVQAAAAPVAPVKAAAPAAPATDEPLASAGECMNVIVTARAKKVNLASLLEDNGLSHLHVDNLTGMTKASFKLLKAAM